MSAPDAYPQLIGDLLAELVAHKPRDRPDVIVRIEMVVNEALEQQPNAFDPATADTLADFIVDAALYRPGFQTDDAGLPYLGDAWLDEAVPRVRRSLK
jgi:hypothetical protein